MDKSRIFGRKTIYVATVSAILSMTAGFAFASLYTSTQVTQTAGFVGTSSQSVANFPLTTGTVTLAPGSGGVNVCSSAQTMAGNTSGFGSNVSATVSVTGACSAADFAEVFTFSSAATLAAGHDTFNVYTTYTEAGQNSTSVALSYTLDVSTSGGTNGGGTFTLVVDYGSQVPPTTISNLQVFVSGA